MASPRQASPASLAGRAGRGDRRSTRLHVVGGLDADRAGDPDEYRERNKQRQFRESKRIHNRASKAMATTTARPSPFLRADSAPPSAIFLHRMAIRLLFDSRVGNVSER